LPSLSSNPPGLTSRPKKAKGAKRTTRGQLAERKGPKPLSQLIEEARLDLLLPSDPSYLRAEQGPPQFEAPRRYCSVCGFTSTCVSSLVGVSALRRRD
jgi:zinc finger HIT domain-containing protein 1